MKIKFIQEHYKDLSELLNCLKVGVYITDGEGKTLIVNDESCKTGGLARNQVEGKDMKTLEQLGFVENSVTLLALKSGKEENIIQNLGDGGRVFVTGVPLYLNDRVEAVVSTERDITETLHLREVLKEKEFDRKKYENEIEYLKSQNIKMWGNLIAEDDVSKVIAEKALRISKMDTTVLLLGESGTGKEVYANFIYKNSKRVGKPFIKINCAAIPENLMESELFGYEAGSFTGADRAGKIGLFEMANTGTIFLDEIGDLPIQMQSKLLRVLQEKEIMRVGGTQTIALDIRLIVATNRNLEEEIEKGKFREDLYYRLNIIPIELPPLRGRIKDIKALTKYFVSNFSVEYKINKTIDDDAIQLLQTHDWAGNIRELENIIERLMISFDGEKITRFQVEKTIGKQEKFPKEEIYQDKSYKEILAMMEEEFLTNLLKKYGRASKISEVYQIDKATLSRKMRRYGLNRK